MNDGGVLPLLLLFTTICGELAPRRCGEGDRLDCKIGDDSASVLLTDIEVGDCIISEFSEFPSLLLWYNASVLFAFGLNFLCLSGSGVLDRTVRTFNVGDTKTDEDCEAGLCLWFGRSSVGLLSRSSCDWLPICLYFASGDLMAFLSAGSNGSIVFK